MKAHLVNAEYQGVQNEARVYTVNTSGPNDTTSVFWYDQTPRELTSNDHAVKKLPTGQILASSKFLLRA